MNQIVIIHKRSTALDQLRNMNKLWNWHVYQKTSTRYFKTITWWSRWLSEVTVIETSLGSEHCPDNQEEYVSIQSWPLCMICAEKYRYELKRYELKLKNIVLLTRWTGSKLKMNEMKCDKWYMKEITEKYHNNCA